MPAFVVDPSIDVNFSSLKGKVSASFYDLVRHFGEPVYDSYDYKTQCQWTIQFEDGIIATIYDYKMGNIPVDQIGYWSVGGYTFTAYHRVLSILDGEDKE